jgi:DNA-binding winged helix-turn-helix (wHTH) protein
MDEGMQALDFGHYRLLPAKRLLTQGGVPVPLSGRAFDILMILIERREDVVSKDELMRRVWGQTVVEENTLAVHLSALRKALRDGKQGMRYIGTVPRRGYKFVAPVEAPCEDPAVAPQTIASGQLPQVDALLIGRDAQLAAVADSLRAAPLVTLTGPGGIGKTRLAVAVGERVRSAFSDGVCWVDLAPVTDMALVAGTVAQALGLPLGSAPALAQLAASLKGQRRLLILDNCEQIAAGAADLAVALRDAKEVRLLATSLEPLGVAGERVERLEPLALPPPSAATTAAALEAPAVQLFLARARALAQDFTLDADNVAAVVRVCRWLEGVPLALELAAARAAPCGRCSTGAMGC